MKNSEVVTKDIIQGESKILSVLFLIENEVAVAE
jgi:hypothetical protein